MTGLARDAPDRGHGPHSRLPLRLLAGVLFAESLGIAGITAFLVVETLTETPDSYAAAIGITVLCAIAAVWVAAIAVNTLRGRAWVRGAVITVQVLTIAVAIGSFQGLTARADIGWLLLVPAIAALVLLFSRPVIAATTQRG